MIDMLTLAESTEVKMLAAFSESERIHVIFEALMQAKIAGIEEGLERAIESVRKAEEGCL